MSLDLLNTYTDRFEEHLYEFLLCLVRDSCHGHNEDLKSPLNCCLGNPLIISLVTLRQKFKR